MKIILRCCSFFFAAMFIFVNINAQNMNDMKMKISEVNDKLEKAMVDDDINTLMMYYTDDAISLPSYNKMTRGKEQIRKASEQAPEKIKSVNFETVDVFGEGKYLYEIGTYDIALEVPQVGDIQDMGKYLTVWEMQPDGGWKVKAEIWNTDTSPQEMMQMIKSENNTTK